MNTSLRSALIYSDIFPPMAAVGVHRVLAMCQYLVKNDWNVTVITQRPTPDDMQDGTLLKRVPPEITVVRTASPNIPLIVGRLLKRTGSKSDNSNQDKPQPPPQKAPDPPPCKKRILDWLSWWLQIPDSRTGWLTPAVVAGLRQARKRRPDVIFATAPIWTGLMSAAVLARIIRVPFVADFRDPWHGSPFKPIPYRAHQRTNALLEKMVVNTAAQVTCAWDGIRQLMAQRYPRKTDYIRTILNGFEPQQIDPIAPLRLDDTRFVLLHTGSLYGPRSPIGLLDALQLLTKNSPELAQKILVVLIGMPTYNGQPIAELARLRGVDHQVRVIPSVAHERAIAYLKGADIALLLGQSGQGILASIPAKAYEYIGAGKDVLTIGAGDEVCGVMKRGGCRVWRSDDEPNSIAASMKDIFDDNRQKNIGKKIDQAERNTLTRTRMARELANVLQNTAIGPDRVGFNPPI